jgi:hypothetical protein
VYSQYELIKIKLKKLNYTLLLFVAAYKFNVCYGPFSKTAAPPPALPKPTQLLLRRHNDLRTCIPGLEGTSVMRSPYCLYVCVSPLSTFECLNAHLNGALHKSLPPQQSMCLYVVRQRFGKNVTSATNTHAIVGRVVLYAVRIVSQESRQLVISRTPCLQAPMYSYRP